MKIKTDPRVRLFFVQTGRKNGVILKNRSLGRLILPEKGK